MGDQEMKLEQTHRGRPRSPAIAKIPENLVREAIVEFRVLAAGERDETGFGHVRSLSAHGVTFDVVALRRNGNYWLTTQYVAFNHLVATVTDGEGIGDLLDLHFRPMPSSIDGPLEFKAASVEMNQREILKTYFELQYSPRAIEFFFYLLQQVDRTLFHVKVDGGRRLELDWKAAFDWRACASDDRELNCLRWFVPLLVAKHETFLTFAETALVALRGAVKTDVEVVQARSGNVRSSAFLGIVALWQLMAAYVPTPDVQDEYGRLAGELLQLALAYDKTLRMFPDFWAEITPLPGTGAAHDEALKKVVTEAVERFDFDCFCEYRREGLLSSPGWQRLGVEDMLSAAIVQKWWSEYHAAIENLWAWRPLCEKQRGEYVFNPHERALALPLVYKRLVEQPSAELMSRMYGKECERFRRALSPEERVTYLEALKTVLQTDVGTAFARELMADWSSMDRGVLALLQDRLRELGETAARPPQS